MSTERINLRKNIETDGSHETMTSLLEDGPNPQTALGFVGDMVRLTGSDFLLKRWFDHLNDGLPQLEAKIIINEHHYAQLATRKLAAQLLAGKEFGWWDIDTVKQRNQRIRDVTSDGQFVNVLGTYALEKVANSGSLMVPNHTDLFPEGQHTVILDALTNATVTNFGDSPLHMITAANIMRLTGGTLCPPYHPGVFMDQAAEKLISIMPMERKGAKVAWLNAGGDAVSVAIAASEKYCEQVHGENGVRQVVFFREAYHGNIECRAGRATSGINQLFHSDDRHSIELEYPDKSSEIVPVLKQIEDLIDHKKTSCIVFESTQGDGGGISMHPEFFTQLVKLSIDKKIPLICDEVQSGFGRSGRIFDVEYLLDNWTKSDYVTQFGYPEKPPIIYALAKSITGGVVAGSAVVIPEEYAVLSRAEGLNTYSAMPATLATTIATVEMMQPELLDMVAHKREVFDKAISPWLSSDSPIREIRGHGLHVFGATVNDRFNEKLQAELLARKRILIGTTARNTIRIHAPLNAPDIVWQALGQCVGEVATDVAHNKISPQTIQILNSGVSGLASR